MFECRVILSVNRHRWDQNILTISKVGAEVAAEDPRAGKFLHGPNMWPSSLEDSDFQAPLMEYLSRLTRVAELLLEMLRQALPNPPSEDLFKEFQERPSTNLRLLHYPPQVSFDERQLGAGAHTDFGGIQTECHNYSPVLTFAQGSLFCYNSQARQVWRSGIHIPRPGSLCQQSIIILSSTLEISSIFVSRGKFGSRLD
jgi:hypothetical protein